MTKPFDELRGEMSQESQDRAEEMAKKMLAEIEQYESDLKDVAYYFDHEPADGTPEAEDFDMKLDRIVAYESKYEWGGPQ